MQRQACEEPSQPLQVRCLLKATQSNIHLLHCWLEAERHRVNACSGFLGVKDSV